MRINNDSSYATSGHPKVRTMRPRTLSCIVERISDGMLQARAIGELLHDFYTCGTATSQLHMLEDAPPLTGQARLDALLGATAEYLAKPYDLDTIPTWASQPAPLLRDSWFLPPTDAPAHQEFPAQRRPP